MIERSKWLLATIGGLVVVYSVFVLGYIATTPDLGLRCLSVDDSAVYGDSAGIVIRETIGLEDYFGQQKPQPGDVLLRIRENPTHTFLHFTRELNALRNAPIPDGGKRPPGSDPPELSGLLPSLLEIGEGERWVEIEFQRQGSDQRLIRWLPVKSLPLAQVLLSLVWFALQMGIFIVGALAYWNRPSERFSRTFFAMCIVTLGASVGGYHWWVVAGSLWLPIPCIICALLVPVVSLHFFTVFPRPISSIAKAPILTLIGLYFVPLISIAAALGVIGYLDWWMGSDASLESIRHIRGALGYLRTGIYAYFVVSALYLVVAMVVLRGSLRRSRNLLERNQLQWIWRAALIAAVCIGLTLLFAYLDRTSFALGPGRIPIFLASLSFMLAYVVGIVRYKLMLIDQIISKGVMYYVVTYGLSISVSLAIAVVTTMPESMNIALSAQQSLTAVAVLVLSVILLLWLRDAAQRTIDRQFFREKYQLDKALRRLNRAAGHLADPEALAQMMLGSCRDVLGVEQAALYLRTRTNGPFQLISAFGRETMPLKIAASRELLESLSRAGSIQRVTAGSRHATSSVQVMMRELGIDLLHALDMDDGIVGLVMLGDKKNSASFTAEDLTFLNALGQLTNVALHSAKVDQDITRLNEELRLKVEKITEQQRQLTILQSELTNQQHDESHSANVAKPEPREFQRDVVIGNSPAISRVFSTVKKVAGSESSILVRGESGTGKELLAEVLHKNSRRGNGPLVCVHCASLSPNLLESELFGHVKGAFTGAHRDRIGRFEMATGGTLFLDEIGDISLETQIKLLRVLQERAFEPVGGTRTVSVDVRLITATHQDLEKLIASGRFREDLYYRLNVISITLPPLRERMEDIFELSLHFLRRAAARAEKRITHINDEAIQALQRHHWPGNIRELENAIERAVVLADAESISRHDLPAEILASGEKNAVRNVFETKPVIPAKNDLAVDVSTISKDESSRSDGVSERKLLEQVLRECNGNKAQAARKLGIPRSTYFSKLKKFKIN